MNCRDPGLLSRSKLPKRGNRSAAESGKSFCEHRRCLPRPESFFGRGTPPLSAQSAILQTAGPSMIDAKPLVWTMLLSESARCLMNVHGFTEVGQQLLGGTAASFVLVGVARLAADQFLIFVSHGAPADPFVALVDVYVIEFDHSLKVALAPYALIQCYFLHQGDICS